MWMGSLGLSVLLCNSVPLSRAGDIREREDKTVPLLSPCLYPATQHRMYATLLAQPVSWARSTRKPRAPLCPLF
jgi:hypothetical protein